MGDLRTSFAGSPTVAELAERAAAHAARRAPLPKGSTFAAQSEPRVDLSTRTAADLRTIAESEGVDLTGCKTKPKILAAIDEHRAALTPSAPADNTKEAT